MILILYHLNLAAPLYGFDSETAIEGEYIVVFKNEIGDHIGKLFLILSFKCSFLESLVTITFLFDDSTPLPLIPRG